jgi:hypothetical protein
LSAIHTAGDRLSRLAESTSERGAVIGFKGSQAGFEQLATRDHDDVEARRDLVVPENLTYQSFRAVSLDGTAKLLRRRDPQATCALAVGEGEDRAEPAMNPGAMLVDVLKLSAPANPLIRLEFEGHTYQLSAVSDQLSAINCYSLLTVRRWRPLARRRFSTRRPFFVLMRTRKPWAFFRCRLFG